MPASDEGHQDMITVHSHQVKSLPWLPCGECSGGGKGIMGAGVENRGAGGKYSGCMETIRRWQQSQVRDTVSFHKEGNGEKWTDPRGTFNTKVWTHGRSSQKWKKWKKTKICPGLYVEMIELITYFIAEDLCGVVADFQDCLYMEDSRARRHYIFYNNPVETPIT